MKIKKEFINLIYNKEKKYEFRNVQDKEGIYRIADKYFKLTYLETDYSISLKKTYMWNKLDYEINDYYVSEYEYNWVENNIDYFKNGQCFKMYVYRWQEIDYDEFELKELEEVE